MPGKFTDKNGANLAGHSDKWSDKNRRGNSHNAGQGSRGSRNMGTGAAGKAQTVASDGIDTSTMSKEDKLRYFNSLGLLKPKAEPVPEPEVQKPVNPMKELSTKLQQAFQGRADLIQDVIKGIQSTPKEELKNVATSILAAIEGSTSPEDAHAKVMSVFHR